MADCQVVAAIDFGTHASGLAYAPAGDRGAAVVIWREFPGTESTEYFKTRTAILRTAAGQTLAFGNEAWLRYRQAQLDDQAAGLDLREDFKRDLKAPDGRVRAAAVADAMEYLDWLRGRALAVIRGTYAGLPEDAICWCVTMPALDAGEREGYLALFREQVLGPAGFPADDPARLLLLAEPDAAAVCCAARPRPAAGPAGEPGEAAWQPGDRFVIVDAGGGTVDITTMEVGAGPGARPVLRQAGRYVSRPLGSRRLNEEFRRLVVRALTRVPGWQNKANPDPRGWLEIMSSWEQDKRTWTRKWDPYRVKLPWNTMKEISPLPAADRGQIADEKLLLPAAEVVAAIFDPVVDGILAGLGEVLDQPGAGPEPGQVILVGGFGGSPYLRERLAGHLARRPRPLPLVRLAGEGGLDLSAEAVLRGAARFALDSAVISKRTMQHTYACESLDRCRRPAEEHRHPHEKWRGSRRGDAEELCRQLWIMARIGEEYEPGTEREAITLVPAGFRQRTVRFTLYRCDAADPYFPDESEIAGTADLKIGWRRGPRRPEITVVFDEAEPVFYRTGRRGRRERIRLGYGGGSDAAR